MKLVRILAGGQKDATFRKSLRRNLRPFHGEPPNEIFARIGAYLVFRTICVIRGRLFL